MNKKQRKQIEDIIIKLESIHADVSLLHDEEEEKYNNLPESLQESDMGIEMDEAVCNLDDAQNALQEALDCLNAI